MSNETSARIEGERVTSDVYCKWCMRVKESHFGGIACWNNSSSTTFIPFSTPEAKPEPLPNTLQEERINQAVKKLVRCLALNQSSSHPSVGTKEVCEAISILSAAPKVVDSKEEQGNELDGEPIQTNQRSIWEVAENISKDRDRHAVNAVELMRQRDEAMVEVGRLKLELVLVDSELPCEFEPDLEPYERIKAFVAVHENKFPKVEEQDGEREPAEPKHRLAGMQEANDWCIGSCSCGWVYQLPYSGCGQLPALLGYWSDHVVEVLKAAPVAPPSLPQIDERIITERSMKAARELLSFLDIRFERGKHYANSLEQTITIVIEQNMKGIHR